MAVKKNDGLTAVLAPEKAVLQSTATRAVVPIVVNVAIIEPRKRIRGSDVECPECEGDAFVYMTRSHPLVIAQRLRYYKCSKCSHTFKK